MNRAARRAIVARMQRNEIYGPHGAQRLKWSCIHCKHRHDSAIVYPVTSPALFTCTKCSRTTGITFTFAEPTIQ